MKRMDFYVEFYAGVTLFSCHYCVSIYFISTNVEFVHCFSTEVCSFVKFWGQRMIYIWMRVLDSHLIVIWLHSKFCFVFPAVSQRTVSQRSVSQRSVHIFTRFSSQEKIINVSNQKFVMSTIAEDQKSNLCCIADFLLWCWCQGSKTMWELILKSKTRQFYWCSSSRTQFN